MVKVFFLVAVLLMGTVDPAQAQLVEIQTTPSNDPRLLADTGPDLFRRSFLDFETSGQVQASAQVLRLRIGEPRGFSTRVYLLAGATNTVFGEDELNANAIAELISPAGGILNLSFNPEYPAWETTSKVTRLTFSAIAAGRMIAAVDTLTRDIAPLGSGFVEAGVRFQTGAWEEASGYSEGGVAWVQLKYAMAFLSDERLQGLVGVDGEAPAGFRLDGGIFIEQKVNIKLSAFLPQSGKDLPGLDSSTLRVALDYQVPK